ncbi:MAG: hypothetical protein AABZ53_09325 [Planctomycetota bacterium]
MNCCHNAIDPAHSAPTSHTSWPRRLTTLLQWALPLTALALIPKCPMCVAAYVLLFTGLGVSISTATTLHWALIALSIGALAYLLLRTARRVFMHTPAASTITPTS